MKSIVLVLLTNLPYLSKAVETIRQARTVGWWQHDIVLCVDQATLLSKDAQELSEQCNVILKVMPVYNIDAVLQFWKQQTRHDDLRTYCLTRSFQHQKYFLLDSYFKQWKTVVYIDAGMHVYKSMSVFETLTLGNEIVAHSDSYPKFEWTLATQFRTEKLHNKQFVETFFKDWPILNSKNYFQSGFLLFRTSICSDTAAQECLDLLNKYPFARGDQGIFNLWAKQKNLKVTLLDPALRLYDSMPRHPYEKEEYVITKWV